MGPSEAKFHPKMKAVVGLAPKILCRRHAEIIPVQLESVIEAGVQIIGQGITQTKARRYEPELAVFASRFRIMVNNAAVIAKDQSLNPIPRTA